MTSAERLAALVGHPVPAEVFAYLSNYPAVLTAFHERLGFAPHERFLYPDLDTLLAQNEEVRAEDIWTEEGPWPADHLDVGADISGDRFALALSESPPGVHRLHHDVGRFERLAPTFQDYVAALERLACGEARSLRDALAGLPSAPAGR